MASWATTRLNLLPCKPQPSKAFFVTLRRVLHSYAFDVDPTSHAFTNRRVFAYADTGIPDGIQVDSKGNVYSGCGDGTQVWNSDGVLLGKFFIGTVSSNMAFAGPGRLAIMAETKVFLANIAAEGEKISFP